VQFSSSAAARTYNDRAVDASWNEWICRVVSPQGKDVVDVGCGGGIYSKGFAGAGARSVIGVDKSRQYIEEAIAESRALNSIEFIVGSAERIPLPNESADVVFQRALIHHLSDPELKANAAEAMRLLRRGGLLLVQDRTFEDVQSPDEEHWIRATLFEVAPRLMAFEKTRRPSREGYSSMLADIGYASIQELQFNEVRKTYASFDDLKCEILSRKGKSILFELVDEELERYCDRLLEKSVDHPLIERDSWTVWLAAK
jgi:ubiquinone/menaquinone biosynthesis C-methylase UbiE